MLVCPVCAFRNPHSNERCIRCNALLQRNQEIIDQAMYEGAEKARKQYLRDLVAAPLEKFARAIYQPSWAPRTDLGYRFPYTAGALSVLPGLGQLYNGQIGKAITLFTAWLALLVLCVFTITAAFSNALLLALVVMWMLIWNDAVGTAIRTNGQRWPLRNSLALLFGGFALVGAFLTAAQFFGLSIVSFVRMKQDVSRPQILINDRVWVNHVGYWFRKPRLNEMIWYDPPRFTAEAGNNMYSVDVKSYFQRVIGTEGDHVQKKGGAFVRNGDEIPRSEWPIGGELMMDFDVMVPAGHVLAPVINVPQDALGNLIGSIIAPTMASFSYVGQDGFGFPDWQKHMMVPIRDVYGRAVAVVDPPEHRHWF
jgi:signal peptidase I/TM2 domain-containing membrane protein YozV